MLTIPFLLFGSVATLVIYGILTFFLNQVPLLEDNSVTARNINVLQDHPMCGIPTGGKDECWWSCSKIYASSPGDFGITLDFSLIYIVDPFCLEKCFPDDSCFSSLLNDYKIAGGVCKGSFPDILGFLNASDLPCSGFETAFGFLSVTQGLCSPETLSQIQSGCLTQTIEAFRHGRIFILQTVDLLLQGMCGIPLLPQPTRMNEQRNQTVSELNNA